MLLSRAEPRTSPRPSADRAYVIERGQIRFEGTIAALSRDEAMRDAYLGV